MGRRKRFRIFGFEKLIAKKYADWQNDAKLNKVPSKFSPSLGENDGKFISTWNFGINMSKAILYNVIGILVVLAIIVFKIPIIWVIVGILILLVFVMFDPFMPTVESIPKGFAEKKFSAGKIVLNYIEGPDNGPPLLFIPGQMEFWQGYKLVIPNFSKDYHVFVVDI